MRALAILACASATASSLNGALPSAHADAFTGTPYCGNPACVVLLRPGSYPEETWMQQVANEMHLSETAFLLPHAEPSSYDLRWFTPTAEVDLCGHATLASAAVLWDVHGAGLSRPLTFHSKSGVLTAVRDTESGAISLDFPAEPAMPVPPEQAGEYAFRFITCMREKLSGFCHAVCYGCRCNFGCCLCCGC